MSTDHQRIASILDSRDLNQFIGLKEDDFFEAKGRVPYDLNTAQGRYELAKDISAFANGNGGHIVIGLTHQKLSSENTDEIVGLELFPEGDFSVKQYAGVIKHYVYPPIAGLELKWVEDSQLVGMGLGTIYVPSQESGRKYYLITKIIDEGEPQREIIVGIARRRGADNIPMTGKDLYQLLQQGVSPQAERLTRLEEKIDNLIGRTANVADNTSPLDLLPARIARILEE